MEIISSVAELRARLRSLRSEGAKVGLVPTMGYLHEGHVSLIRRAVEDCDVVVATIFVNPLQFAEGEDLDSYPRDPEGDAAKARAAGTTILFTPDVAEMYPNGRDAVLTTVAVPAIASVMEGASRPTHFAGVCTVVAKIFNIVEPDAAYFGEKDYQQLAIIKQMATDLSFQIEVIGCPTLRESDGLAMSSRNVYLSRQERRAATVLRQALCTGADAIVSGETSAQRVKQIMADVVAGQPLADLDYFEVADPFTLEPVEVAGIASRLFGAVRFSAARLIDNLAVSERAFDRNLDSGSVAGGTTAQQEVRNSSGES